MTKPEPTAPKSAPLPPRWVIRAAWAIHRAIYSVTRGRIGLRPPTEKNWGMMRLTTVGRRSDQKRKAILGYFEDGPNLVTQGSTELVHAMLANDLVDAMSLFTVPVVLGGGKKLDTTRGMTLPFTLGHEIAGPIIEAAVSAWERSMYWPLPVRARKCSAAKIANAPYDGAT